MSLEFSVAPFSLAAAAAVVGMAVSLLEREEGQSTCEEGPEVGVDGLA
jgi:hypothetical protein